MDKFDFMQDMLKRARDRELGLCPEQPEAGQSTPEQSSPTDGPVEGFDGTAHNPLPLGAKRDT